MNTCHMQNLLTIVFSRGFCEFSSTAVPVAGYFGEILLHISAK